MDDTVELIGVERRIEILRKNIIKTKIPCPSFKKFNGLT